MVEPDAQTASDVQPEGTQSTASLQQHLFVVLSCDRPLEGGARHGLAELDEVTIARGETRSGVRRQASGLRHLVVTLPGKQLSGTHARLLRVSARWTLEDCHSTNGTFVNGNRVQRAVLRDGDVIELGRTVLLYRDALPTPRGTAPDLDTRDLESAVSGMATLLPADARDLDALASIAASMLPLLLLGESGTGKEVLAQAVHRVSRRPGAFVPVNCGAIPESLFEGHVFGHVRGAFSGAVRDEIGLVRAADEGTLFLDEIGDLPARSQAALLRILQESEVQAVGSTRTVKVRVRVLAATHRPLAQLADTGSFRHDLYARLNGHSHHLPPLRLRIEDLSILCGSVLRRVAPNGAAGITFAPAAVHAMIRHPWLLNVRELQQVLARAVILCRGERIDPSHLPNAVANAPGSRGNGADAISEEELADEELRRQLIGLMDTHGGNVSEIARAMGKARMQIHRWIKRFGLDPRRYRR
jgi:DNA-binding NtrC family response regulator